MPDISHITGANIEEASLIDNLENHDSEVILSEGQLVLWPDETFAQEVIRSEVNFLVLPFFALSRRDIHDRVKTEYHTIVKRGNERLEASWKVSANPEYGYPGPFDRKVHRAIEQIIGELRSPLENPIPLGSLYRIAKLLNAGNSGQIYRDIKQAIQRIVATTVESKGTFYSKGTQEWIEDQFHLYDRVVFKGRRLPEGETSDNNYLFLSSWFLESVNARYVRPLDYTYHRSLRGEIASRLYELLGVKFYGMHGAPFIRYRYSTLCQLLPVAQHTYLSKAKEKLTPAHDELVRTGFFAKVEWSYVPREGHDWYVTYWPGLRAKEEIAKLPRQASLSLEVPTNMEQRAIPDLHEAYPLSQSVEPASKVPLLDDSVVEALIDVGISKRSAERLARTYPEEYLLGKIDLVQWLLQTNSPLLAKNPAGWLRTAIEEDYTPPKGYESPHDRDRREADQAEAAQRAVEQRQNAKEDYQRVKSAAHNMLKEAYPSEPIGDGGETTETAWAVTLEKLQEQVPTSTYETWLKDTMLYKLEGQAAYIMVPSAVAVAWLERRMYHDIARTLESVLHQAVDLVFVPANSLESQ